MNRFATRYWLQDRPLSVQLWACLSLAEGLTLAAILLYVLLLLRPEEPGQWYRLAALFPLLLIANLFAAKLAARRITEPLERLAGIRKLLYVSSFDHMLGKQSDFRPVELRGLMEECRRRFRGNERGIRLEVDVPAGLTVSGNEAALQTVFDNLVENGLRYAASYIRMELTGEEEGGYLLTVENDGAPIPQPTLNVLFQKFYKGADGNFGLGLYIAKKIVQFHKGDIWASNWADGVRFQLLLRREDRMAGRR